MTFAELLPTGDPWKHPDNANLPLVNKASTILGVTIPFLVIALLCITLRLSVRWKDRLWGWDDAFVLLAGLTSVVGDTMVCLMPGDGLGLHLWTLTAEKMALYFRHVYATNVSYCASAGFIKLSILFQYLRLFAETASSTNSKQYRVARGMTWFMIVFTTLWALGFFFAAAFPCKPISKNWNIWDKGSCVGFGSKVPEVFFAMFTAHSSSNMFLDLLVLLLPVPFLGMLRLAGNSRTALFTLFALGVLVVALSIGRLATLVITRAGTYPIIDMSYHTPSVYIFSVLEVNVAIVAASIPIFWPVIATFSNKIFVAHDFEVRVEHASSTTDLSFNRSVGIGLVEETWDVQGDLTEEAKNGGAGLTVLTKALDRSTVHGARRQGSNGSIGLETGIYARGSADSQRKLNHKSSQSSSSVHDDWFAIEGEKLEKMLTKTERGDVA